MYTGGLDSETIQRNSFALGKVQMLKQLQEATVEELGEVSDEVRK